MNWQPIETAPKDGTAVLLWDDVRFEVGLYDLRGGWVDQDFRVLYPSHWMPLPKTPSTF